MSKFGSQEFLFQGDPSARELTFREVIEFMEGRILTSDDSLGLSCEYPQIIASEGELRERARAGYYLKYFIAKDATGQPLTVAHVNKLYTQRHGKPLLSRFPSKIVSSTKESVDNAPVEGYRFVQLYHRKSNWNTLPEQIQLLVKEAHRQEYIDHRLVPSLQALDDSFIKPKNRDTEWLSGKDIIFINQALVLSRTEQVQVYADLRAARVPHAAPVQRFSRNSSGFSYYNNVPASIETITENSEGVGLLGSVDPMKAQFDLFVSSKQPLVYGFYHSE